MELDLEYGGIYLSPNQLIQKVSEFLRQDAYRDYPNLNPHAVEALILFYQELTKRAYLDSGFSNLDIPIAEVIEINEANLDQVISQNRLFGTILRVTMKKLAGEG